MGVAVHATFFDASALVKLYVDEPGSDNLRAYWRGQATRYTSPFCFYETLSILKGKHKKGKLTKEQYLRAAKDLMAWFRASTSRINDLDFTKRDVFADATGLADRHDLDLSDAFQLLTLQAGFFSVLVGGSASVLVTADEELAQAARKMNLAVWDCQRQPIPAT